MGVLSPTSFRICRTTSMPFISGMSQSMMNALNASADSLAYRVRSTASLPEVVHSGRMPMVESILQTEEQVLKSSSATSVWIPFSSGIGS